MTAIFKREFKSFFTSPLGYVFVAANLFMIGIYFTAYNLAGAYPFFSYTVSSSVIVFFITIPILTMRCLAEERKTKTDQLLLTSPVSVGKIVIGKFLAVAAVLGIVMIIISFYPLIMNLYGEVPMLETYNAILGFYLYGLAGASVGIFISSLTESQIIAAVLSFAFMFITYFMQGICSIISSTGNLLTKLLSCLDFITNFDKFLNGTFDIKAVIYFLTIIVLMLFLTTQSIQKRRYSISAQNISLSAYSTVSVVVAIVVAIFFNVIIGEIPEKYTIFDTTQNKLYTISNETKAMLNALDKDVKVYVYCKEESMDATISELLKRYDGQTGKLTVEYIDPSVYPTFTTAYTTSTVSSGSLIVVCGDKSKVVDYESLYESTSSIDYTTYTYVTNTTGFDGEGQLTSAIAYVTGEDTPTVYYTAGHGELEIDALISEAVEKSNMALEQITLLLDGEIPEDAEMLIINNPSSDFSDDDISLLKNYIEKGGNVIFNFYSGGDDLPNLWNLLSEMGVTITNTLVMESNKNNYYSYPYYLLPSIASDTVTSSVYNTYYVFAPFAMGMTINETLPSDVTVTELLYTSSDAYAKDIKAEINSYEKTEDDLTGPFTIAAKINKTNEDGSESKIIVNACGDMFNSDVNKMISGGNAKYFNGVLTELSNLELTVSIPAKSLETSYLTITAAQVGMWRSLCLFVLPIALLIAGITIWTIRRKK